MEIKCPLCDAEFPAPEPGHEMPSCPRCGARLTVEMDSPGFAIVSGEEGLPPEEGMPMPGAEEDPILEDHARWRHRALFLILTGIVGVLGVGLASWSDWSSYGVHFFLARNNQAALAGILALFLFMTALGSLIYYLVRRETRIYLAARDERLRSR
ncbi:MAG: hypothetical protein AB1921_03670 [Thermodesulfobacteriota bacterium]